MKLFSNRKKAGFTLMEVAIAVMIVGILIALCIPVVQRQLEKSDEYAYYMAYRSVEKLGGQIVALGDPEDTLYNTSSSNDIKLALEKPSTLQLLKNKIVYTFSTLGTRFSYTEKYLFKNLFPKSFAEGVWSSTGSSLEDGTYYFVNMAYRVCKDGETIQDPSPTGTDDAGNPIYRNLNCTVDFPGAFDEGAEPIDLIIPSEYCLLGLTDAEKATKKRELETFVRADKSAPEALNIKSYCEKLASYCGGLKDGYEYRLDAPKLEQAASSDDGDDD